jgi:hypothetical protein
MDLASTARCVIEEHVPNIRIDHRLTRIARCFIQAA